MNFTPAELERYSRQIQLPGFGEEGQKRLKDSTAVVTGVGGLGGTVALYLAVAGVGKIILVRGGDLRLDDLNRQILMTNSWVGQPRVYKAKETLLNINPEIEIEAVNEFVTEENIDALVQQADIAFDCAFDFKERNFLNTACVRWGVPMVEAAMSGMDAYLTTIIPGETPCLSCIFPEKPEWDRWGFGVSRGGIRQFSLFSSPRRHQTPNRTRRTPHRSTIDHGIRHCNLCQTPSLS
jgi:molybdopterin/thiamine biosynthesis adenylyltransferase